MKKLQKAFETSVNICFVSDEKYAKPLCTSLYSLLYNRDKTRNYDILILQDDIPAAGLKFGRFVGRDEYTTADSDRLVRLPLYYNMKSSDLRFIVDKTLEYFGKDIEIDA